MSIEQRRLVVVHLLEDSPHECLPDQPASIAHAIARAETIQCAHLTLVEHDRDPEFASLLFHHK